MCTTQISDCDIELRLFKKNIFVKKTKISNTTERRSYQLPPKVGREASKSHRSMDNSYLSYAFGAPGAVPPLETPSQIRSPNVLPLRTA